jgi:hypothetical protein
VFVFRFVAESSNICCFYVQLQPPAPRLWLPQWRWGRCRRQFLLFCHLPLTSTSSATVVAPLVPGGSEAAIAWATMINAISGYSSTPLKLNVQCVFIANGLPTVPKSLLERIQKWEYVDLAHLLPAQSLHDQVSETRAMFTLFPGCELVRPKKRQIQSIMEWVNTFTVFTAAVALKDPAQVVEFLAYQLTKAAQSYNGLQWRAYDTHFRVANAPGNKARSKLDIDLYTRYFTGRARTVLCCTVCDSSQNTAANFPSGRKDSSKPAALLPTKQQRSWNPDVCQLFNTTLCPFGQKYKYKHTCGECGGSHYARAWSFTPKPAAAASAAAWLASAEMGSSSGSC